MSFLTVFLSFLLLRSVYAIEVTPNSPCSSLCLTNPSADPTDEASSTQNTMLVCDDWELSSGNQTNDGVKFHDCLACEANSTAFDKKTNQNDVYWFLFNMKYTIDWCLFQYQFNNATTQSRQCGKTCAGPEGAMRIAMTDRVLQTNATIQYQYCESGDGAFESNVDDCVSCLEDVPSSMALANYLRALKAGCEQRPKPGSDTPLKLDFELYNLDSSTSSPSTTSASSSTASPASTITVTASPVSSSSPSNAQALKLGLGLGLGLGLPLLLIATAAFLFFRRRNRLHSQSKIQEHTELGGTTHNRNTRSSQHQRPEMQGAHVQEWIPEADDGKQRLEADDGEQRTEADDGRKPPVPEKDRWLLGGGGSTGTRSRSQSVGEGLPVYKREGSGRDGVPRGELDAGAGAGMGR